ncbi:hypothetical protein C0Q70_07207 [Pomacea canaliculata]|uniref:Cadherin domain-containing protein n=1 Tax=Pomacea canaliculata TaxID=400727 RepID=A0A2T7PEE3_POMCA|nr:hypothetical protein C0Q70_07207 [Pomacea canaliculata]
MAATDKTCERKKNPLKFAAEYGQATDCYWHQTMKDIFHLLFGCLLLAGSLDGVSSAAPTFSSVPQPVVALKETETQIQDLLTVTCTGDIPLVVSLDSTVPSSPCGTCFQVYPRCGGGTGYCLRYLPGQGTLKFSQVSNYVITLSCKDINSLSATTTVNVRIEPNTPPYPLQATKSYTLANAKNAAIGTSVTSASCNDDDTDALSYSMTSTDGIIRTSGNLAAECRSQFDLTVICTDNINSVVGTSRVWVTLSASNVITVGSALDYEQSLTRNTNLTVTCSDGYCTSYAGYLYVIVTDVNEPITLYPRDFTLSTYEGKISLDPGWTPIDPDENDYPTYTIVGGNSKSRFAINPTTGLITSTLDYDIDQGAMPSTDTIIVQVKDVAGHTSTTTVTLTILDLNDNAPIFNQQTQEITITDCTTSLGVIGTVTATDKDSSFQALPHYHNVNNNNDYQGAHYNDFNNNNDRDHLVDQQQDVGDGQPRVDHHGGPVGDCPAGSGGLHGVALLRPPRRLLLLLRRHEGCLERLCKRREPPPKIREVQPVRGQPPLSGNQGFWQERYPDDDYVDQPIRDRTPTPAPIEGDGPLALTQQPWRINFRSLAYITFVIKSSTRSHTRHPLTFPSQRRKYLSSASSPGVCWCNIPVYTGFGRHDRTGTGVEKSCLKTLDTAPLRLCVTRSATATSFPSPGSASRCRTLQRMYIDDEISQVATGVLIAQIHNADRKWSKDGEREREKRERKRAKY